MVWVDDEGNKGMIVALAHLKLWNEIVEPYSDNKMGLNVFVLVKMTLLQ